MNWHSGVFLVLVVLVAVTAWVGVLFIIPSCQHGRFRNRMWELRDQLTDDIIDGVLPAHDAVYSLREQIDTFIRYAPEFTFAGMMISRSTLRKAPPLEVSYAGLLPQEIEDLKQHQRQIHDAASAHLLYGSVSGWLAALVIWGLVIPYRRIARKRPPQRQPMQVQAGILAKATREAEIESQLGMLSSTGRRRTRRTDAEDPLFTFH